MSRVFVEIDLQQAESRFVAMDACEETLIRMLETKQDVHRYVAAEIYKKPMAEITHDERQLGKRSGHGANYGMGVATFQDSCLKTMDLVLSRRDAENALQSYYRVFPGLLRWQAQIRETVYRERKLRNPFGFERYFYGRIGDDTYRQAYAWKPQSTIPMIVNHLMFKLCDERRAGHFNFMLHAQVHDSLILSCKPEAAPFIMEFAQKTSQWHPEIVLPAGRLVIPTDSKWGRCLGSMTKEKL